MRHHFLPESIINFKTALIIIAILSLPGVSFADKSVQIDCKIADKFKLPKWYHEGLYLDDNNIWVNNGRKGKTWVIDASNGSMVSQIEPAGTFTEAVTSKEKGKYIVTDWDLKKIYTARIEKDQMKLEDEISVAPAHPAGTVWNGANLFVITWTRTLAGTKFRLLRMDDKFNILSDDLIENIQEPTQLAWDGKYLWVSSWFDQRVYKIDYRTLDILGHIKSPAKKTTGIAWSGKYLWLTGTYSDLYKMELQN